MKTLFFIQFRFPWSQVEKILSPDIKNRISIPTNINAKYPSLIIEDRNLFNMLMSSDLLVKGESLIRLMREETFIEESDIDIDRIYELHYKKSFGEELKLVLDPSMYYDLQTECNICGRYLWNQRKDLEIKTKFRREIASTENGEIIVSLHLKDILIDNGIQNIEFRRTKNGDAWQIIGIKEVNIKQDSKYIRNKDICDKCKQPRLRNYEDSNEVNLFSPPYNVVRIERTPVLLLKNAVKDFAFSDIKFGTLGRTPNGSPKIASNEFTHKTSMPKIVVSGKFCKILFGEKINDFVITKVEIE